VLAARPAVGTAQGSYSANIVAEMQVDVAFKVNGYVKSIVLRANRGPQRRDFRRTAIGPGAIRNFRAGFETDQMGNDGEACRLRSGETRLTEPLYKMGDSIRWHRCPGSRLPPP
jgi:hypothetical protein